MHEKLFKKIKINKCTVKIHQLLSSIGLKVYCHVEQQKRNTMFKGKIRMFNN